MKRFAFILILFLLFATYRIDFYNKKSERTGYAIVKENGHIDFFNKKSERIWHGKIEEVKKRKSENGT